MILIIHIVKKEKAKKKNAEIFKKDVIIKDKTEEGSYLENINSNLLNDEEIKTEENLLQENFVVEEN